MTHDNDSSQQSPSSRATAMTPGVPWDHQHVMPAISPAAPAYAGPGPAGWQTYGHALRRHIVAAIGLGLLGAGLLGALVWFLMEETYTSSALLQVALSEQQLVFDTSGRSIQGDFEIFKATQKEIIKSPYVLNAALRPEEINTLPMVSREIDQVRWLGEELVVDSPEKSEIMRVSLSGDDPQATTTVVRAVVQAYLGEAVERERNRRRIRLDELERIYADKETELRGKRTSLRQLAEQLGTGDSQALSLKQEIALQQFGEFRRELVRIQFELRKASGDLKVREAALKAKDGIKPSAAILSTAKLSDPVIRQLLMARTEIEDRAEYTKRVDRAQQFKDRYKSEMDDIAGLIASREEELHQLLRDQQRAAVEAEVENLQTQIAVLTDQEQQLAKDLEGYRKEAERVGVTSIDVEMMRTEIEHLEAVLGPIAEERERLKVELGTTPRVSLLQEAQPPQSPDTSPRIALTVLAILAGIALPLFAIAHRDVRARRINSSSEVVTQVGLSVIGSVPVVPAGAIQHTGPLSRRNQRWRSALHESFNSIVARLLRKAESEQSRVILVSSAASGEGKTTLATQLAIHLARTGYRTLLVDFDLRCPAVHRVFGVDLEPGVSDVLYQSLPLDQVIRPDIHDKLSLLTAGRWNPDSLGLLLNGTTESLFGRLRSQYEFVVIDGGPILPVADTRLVSHHVDMVILSILRDVSRAPQVAAACGILAAFGVRNVEAVVTGSLDDTYCAYTYGHHEYWNQQPVNG